MSMSTQDPTTHPTVVAFVEAKEAKRDPLPLSALDDVPAALRDIAYETAQISGTWNAVEFVNPTNAKQQETRFKQAVDDGKVVQPEFVYKLAEDTDMTGPQFKLRTLLARLGAAALPKGCPVSAWFAWALRRKIDDDLATCMLVSGLAGREGSQSDSFTKHALGRKYRPLDDRLLAAAKADYEMRVRPRSHSPTMPHSGRLAPDEQKFLRERRVTAEEMATAFRRELKKHGLLREGDGSQGFKVLVTRDATAIDVRHRSSMGPVVVIPHDDITTEKDAGLDALILTGHEILGHACQAHNGRMLFGIWGGLLTQDEEDLYEGRAMDVELTCLRDYFGEAAETRPYPYVYPLAIDMAMGGATFHQIFTDQMERYLRTEYQRPAGVSVPQRSDLSDTEWEKAKYWGWRAALRVMRGHRDCSNSDAFAMPKDLAYERGLEIQRGLNALGLGHYNQAAIIPGHDGLVSLALFDIRPEHLPLGKKYVTDDDVRELMHQLQA